MQEVTSVSHLEALIEDAVAANSLPALESLRQPIERYRNSRSNPTNDLRLLAAVGWLHWHLYNLDPDADPSTSDDLQAALAAFEPVHEARAVGGVPLPIRQYFWSNSLNRLSRAGDTGAIVQFLRETLKGRDEEDAALPWLRYQLARAIWLEFDSTPPLPAIKEVQWLLRSYLNELHGDASDRSAAAGILGRAQFLEYRASDTPDVGLLNSSIENSTTALEESDGTQLVPLEDVLEALRVRYALAHDGSDLLLAERVATIAIERTRGLPLESRALHELVKVYLWRAELQQSVLEVEKAISVLKIARDSSADEAPAALQNMSSDFIDAFKATALPRALDGAVLAARHGLSLSADSGQFPLPGLIANLTAALQLSSSTDSLAEIVELLGRQESNVTDIDPETRASLLNEEASLYLSIFSINGAVENLTQTIDLLREACEAIPASSPNLCILENNLCNALTLRHMHDPFAPESDIDDAKIAGLRATATSSLALVDLVAILQTYGTALQFSADRGKPEDVVEGLAVARRALKIAESEAPAALARTHQLLSNLYRIRHELVDDPNDLDLAIEHGRIALEGSPAGSGRLCVNLGRLHATRLQMRGDVADWEEARRLLELVTTFSAELPEVKIDADRLLAEHAAKREEWGVAALALQRAIGELPLLVPREAARGTKERRLRSLEGLASFAAEAWLECGDPVTALELLEQARTVMLGQDLEARSEFQDLRSAHPDLAAELADQFASPVMVTSDADPASFIKKQDWSDRMNALLTRIRETEPQFGTFLEPVSAREMLSKLDPASAVVVLNVGRYRADALVCRTTGVIPVRLGVEVVSELSAQVERFLGAVSTVSQSGRGTKEALASEETVSRVIDWLAQHIDLPIESVLSAGPTTKLTRIYWCSAGRLALLPVHAAWPAELPGSRATTGAAQSIIPSIRALQHSRERRRVEPSSPRLLLVGAPDVPGYGRLPDLEPLSNFLERCFPQRVDRLGAWREEGEPGSLSSANFDSVVEGIESHSWCHFYCHGQYSPTDPSLSCLVLPDHESSPLSVAELVAADAAFGEFAFLAACSTATTGSLLSDEQIHLVSAFQVAGFRHVIGTLWPVWSDDVALLTQTFYARLLSGGAFPAATHAPFALALAVEDLRRRHPTEPSRWAAFVHSGE